MHGPTSILCSQVLPVSCVQCYPTISSPPSTTSDSETPTRTGVSASSPTDTRKKQLQQSNNNKNGKSSSNTSRSSQTSSRTATSKDNIENHPSFVRTSSQPDVESISKSGATQGDTCASCSFTLPQDISKKLPAGAPGSPRKDGDGRNGSPVLRSRELVHSCGNQHNHSDVDDTGSESNLHHSSPGSTMSSSASSDSSCHNHLITYLSLRGPPNAADYAVLRRSSIRTLSCELLPRGLSSGPLSFGDAQTGYTIAYIFRLPDPRARGKRRSYALVALAGKDASRAFRASPLIWRIFGGIAANITAAAEQSQEEERRREAGERSASVKKAGGCQYTPVSSFLTGRTLAVDPSGQPLRGGQIRAKSLAEITGNEYIFAELHAQFVALLQQLGHMLGGLPICEEPVVCSTIEEEDEPKRQAVTNLAPGQKVRKKSTPTVALDMASLEISKKQNDQQPSVCSPVTVTPNRPVMV